MKISNLRAKFKPKGCKGNIHFGKILLTLMLVCGMVLGNVEPVKASEPLYYYDVYNTKYEYSYSIGGRRGNNYEYLPAVYPSFYFNKDTGKFILSGKMSSVKDIGSGYYGYPANGASEIERIGYLGTVYDEYGDYYELWKEKYTVNSPEKVRGSYIKQVIAEEGTYPDNGIQGGYWYVRKGLANNNPTLSISTPSENSYFV